MLNYNPKKIFALCYIELYFSKKYDNTSRRVLYEGTLRSEGSGVCNQWTGILHLMAQNVQNQQLLKQLFGLNQPLSTPYVTAILKATVTRLLKETYMWASG